MIDNGKEIPEGMFICHHCDNPSCVRPEHLFLGTPKDNNHDMIRKGRANYPSGKDHVNFGKKLPISTRLKMSIKKSGKNNPMFGRERSGELNGNNKLKLKDVEYIRKTYVKGRKGIVKLLCEKYKVTPPTIFNIIKGKTWKDK